MKLTAHWKGQTYIIDLTHEFYMEVEQHVPFLQLANTMLAIGSGTLSEEHAPMAQIAKVYWLILRRAGVRADYREVMVETMSNRVPGLGELLGELIREYLPPADELANLEQLQNGEQEGNAQAAAS